MANTEYHSIKCLSDICYPVNVNTEKENDSSKSTLPTYICMSQQSFVFCDLVEAMPTDQSEA